MVMRLGPTVVLDAKSLPYEVRHTTLYDEGV
jgi:hypothetical protein